MQVTAYYTNHSPYTLTKSSEIDRSFDFKGLDGTYQNGETDVWLTLKHLDNANYEVIFGDSTKEGLLISLSKMLVGSYVFEFKENVLFLSGGRIKNVRFVKQ